MPPLSDSALSSSLLLCSARSTQLGFFDPLNLVADGDQAKFDRLRYVEIKHGRICMLAVAGYLVQEAGVRLPGNIDFSGLAFADIPNGFAALTTIQGAGVAQIVAFIGVLELFVMKDITGGEFVGDFRNEFIDFGWCVQFGFTRRPELDGSMGISVDGNSGCQ